MSALRIAAGLAAAITLAWPQPALAQPLLKDRRLCEATANQEKLDGRARQQFIDRCMGGKPAPKPAAAAAAKPRAELKKSAKAKENAEQRCARQAALKGLEGRGRAQYISRCLKGA